MARPSTLPVPPNADAILLAAAVVTPEELRHARAVAADAGCRLCDALSLLGLADEVRVAQAMSRELSAPLVLLDSVEPKEDWLRWIPSFVAEQYMLVPAYVRQRGVGTTTVYVAMEDPTDEEALRVCSRWAGLPVRPMVAPRSHIERAIRRWYPRSDESDRPTLPPPTVRVYARDSDCPSGVYARREVLRIDHEGFDLDDILEAAG